MKAMFRSKLAQRTLDLTLNADHPAFAALYQPLQGIEGDVAAELRTSIELFLLSFARSAARTRTGRTPHRRSAGSVECYVRTDASEVMSDDAKYIPLALPTGASTNERRGFVRLCTLLARAQFDPDMPLDHAFWITAAELGYLYNKPRLAAAVHTLIDLVDQGWAVQVDKLGPLLSPPDSHLDRETEKARIRRQS